MTLAVFGSMATQTNRLNSDCDLLVVIADHVSVKAFKQQLNVIEKNLVPLEMAMYHTGVDMFFYRLS